MITNLSDLCDSSGSSSSLDSSNIIEQYVDSETSELSQSPINAELSQHLDHHSSGSDSSSLQEQKRQEGQMKDHGEVMSIRGGGSTVTAPVKDAPIIIRSGQIEGNDRLMLVGSLPGTPSTSSSQFYDDSDECAAKPLAEELEEADNRKTVDENPSNGMLVDSDESSSSEFYSSENESEEEGLKSGEQQSSEEEIDFKLQEGDLSPQKLSNEEQNETPLLAALTTASQLNLASRNSSKTDSSKLKEDKKASVMSEGDLQSLPGKVDTGKESSTPQSRELQKVPAAGGHAMNRSHDPALNHDVQIIKSVRSNGVYVAQKSPSLLAPLPLEGVHSVGDVVAKHLTENTEVNLVKPNVTPDGSKVQKRHIPILQNGGLKPKRAATPLVLPQQDNGANHHQDAARESPNPHAVKAESTRPIQKERSRIRSTVQTPYSNKVALSGTASKTLTVVSGPTTETQLCADEKPSSQGPRIQQEKPNEGPTTTTTTPFTMHLSPGKKVPRFLPPKKPSVSGRIEAFGKNAEHSGAQVISNAATIQSHPDRRGEIRSPQYQPRVKTGPEKEKESREKTNAHTVPKPKKRFEFQLEDLTHTDSEVSIISEASEVLSPATVSHESALPKSSIRDVQPYSPVPPQPDVSPSITAMGPCHPLKGILKKKARHERWMSTASAHSDITTVTPLGSDGEKSEEEAFKKTESCELETQQSTLSTMNSSPPVSVETNVSKCVSNTAAPLSNQMVSPHKMQASALDNSLSNTPEDDGDLDRTLTEEPITNTRPTPTADTQSIIVGNGSRPTDVFSLDQLAQTDSEITLVTSDDEVPQVSLRRSEGDLITVNSTALQISLPTTPQSTTNSPHPAAHSNMFLSFDQLTHTDSETTLLSNDDVDTTPKEEPDGLPMSCTVTQPMIPLQGDNNLVATVSTHRIRTVLHNQFAK